MELTDSSIHKRTTGLLEQTIPLPVVAMKWHEISLMSLTVSSIHYRDLVCWIIETWVGLTLGIIIISTF